MVSQGMQKGTLIAGIVVGMVAGIAIEKGYQPPPKVEIHEHTKFVKIPQVYTRDVPGPTKYIHVPMPSSCKEASQYIVKSYKTTAGMELPAEQIIARIEDSLAIHVYSHNAQALVGDDKFISDQATKLSDALSAWHEYSSTARESIKSCEGEASGKKSDWSVVLQPPPK